MTLTMRQRDEILADAFEHIKELKERNEFLEEEKREADQLVLQMLKYFERKKNETNK